MATDDNFTNRMRSGSRSNLLEMLDAQAGGTVREPAGPVPEPGSQGELPLLPHASDPYVAHARPSHTPEVAFYCIDAKGHFEGFVWSLLERFRLEGPSEAGGGPVLVLRFHGSEVSEVRIEGSNLDALRVFLPERRVKWIRVLGGINVFGMGGNDAVITRITVEKIAR